MTVTQAKGDFGTACSQWQEQAQAITEAMQQCISAKEPIPVVTALDFNRPEILGVEVIPLGGKRTLAILLGQGYQVQGLAKCDHQSDPLQYPHLLLVKKEEVVTKGAIQSNQESQILGPLALAA